MKFIGVRDFRTQSARIWNNLKKEQNMVITSNGKPIAILTATSEDNLEESLLAIRRANAIEALQTLRFNSLKNNIDSLSYDDINQEIQTYRKGKKR